MSLTNLENKISKFEQETSALKGRVDTLEESFIKTEKEIKELKKVSVTNKKAVELLNLVQKATEGMVQSSFEDITTNALNFIHQSDDYKFKLSFDKRGNLSTLNFIIQTEGMKEPHDILLTNGGGSCDIVSLALRLILLDLSKTKGFVFFDECLKHLDSEETVIKAVEFLKEMQKNTGRQMFLVTHKPEVCEQFDNVITIE